MVPNNTTPEYWIEHIKSSYINNDKDYTTIRWMQLETGKPTKKVTYEMRKLVQQGLIIKVTTGKAVRYRLKDEV